MKVLVAGAGGLVGTRLANALIASGHEVAALVRSVARAAPALPGATLLAQQSASSLVAPSVSEVLPTGAASFGSSSAGSDLTLVRGA